ncbi:hypothetical protein K458DRAFT_145502 [Lentithecium fluviatile CBS 122367]|uniref:Uncharacterized protein n=1 Tax=Lentithecium fluviatile CBS 122367 TaxID=1168545 RepID=A0A6G1IIH9_9PLEO|nr:hypothetical protein K458DRAFT_145502 [Lentithecium fluviatile CBS 122367]
MPAIRARSRIAARSSSEFSTADGTKASTKRAKSTNELKVIKMSHRHATTPVQHIPLTRATEAEQRRCRQKLPPPKIKKTTTNPPDCSTSPSIFESASTAMPSVYVSSTFHRLPRASLAIFSPHLQKPAHNAPHSLRVQCSRAMGSRKREGRSFLPLHPLTRRAAA